MGFLFWLIIFGAVVYWMVGGGRPPRKRSGEILILSREPFQETQDSKTLRILTWNLSYAHGEGSEGPGFQMRGFAHYWKTLEKMAEVIKDSRADIVFLQEVDFDSRRSYGMDQLAFLQERTGAATAARASSWRAAYVPFPYWPPARHFGRVVSGGGILSRYPIVVNHVGLLEKPKNLAWYQMPFYPYRFCQEIMVQIGSDNFWFINNHWEAFDRVSRKAHAEKVSQLIRKNPGKVVCFGGDLNTVPSTAQRQSGFAGGDLADYRGDETQAVLATIKDFRDLVPQAESQAHEEKYWTFPALHPDRRLDYLFVHDRHKIHQIEFLETGGLSDHRPILVEIDISGR